MIFSSKPTSKAFQAVPELTSRFDSKRGPYAFPIITLTCLKGIPLIIKCTSYKRVVRLIDRIPRSQPSTTVQFTQSKPEQEAFLLIYQKCIKTGLNWSKTGCLNIYLPLLTAGNHLQNFFPAHALCHNRCQRHHKNQGTDCSVQGRIRNQQKFTAQTLSKNRTLLKPGLPTMSITILESSLSTFPQVHSNN